MTLVEILKALSHENRIRIINLLDQQELCVCELENIMEINQSNASRHLTKLKQAGLIEGQQSAQWIYYKINENTLTKHPFLQSIIENELDSPDICQADNKRLAKYQASGLSCRELRDNVSFD